MKKKVLLIDDEDWFVEPIQDRLEHEGIACTYCRTGSAGLTEFRRHRDQYAVVVLDIRLTMSKPPDDEDATEWEAKRSEGGVFLLEKLRAADPDIPVICYTVLDDVNIVQRIRDRGGTHLAKAADEVELYRIIHNCLKEDPQ